MARIHVTAAALSRLRELRDSCGPEPVVVAIYWIGPQADSRRRPDGSTEWVRVSEGEWRVGFDSRERFKDWPVEVIDDVEFIVNGLPKFKSIEGRTLDYADGKFHVN